MSSNPPPPPVYPPAKVVAAVSRLLAADGIPSIEPVDARADDALDAARNLLWAFGVDPDEPELARPIVQVAYDVDHEVTFGEDGTPMLSYVTRYQDHGPGWVLWYLEDESETARVDSYYIGGDLTDVDFAVDQAQRWLEMNAEARERWVRRMENES